MYPAPFRYHRAASVGEASKLLMELGEGARPLAGGQSLLPLMKLRIDQPADLIDIGRIPGLGRIEEASGEIRIGALVTHAVIARADIANRVPIVGDCARGISDNQVRSRGTIGGNVSSGDPSCDWPTLLTVMDALVHCEGPSGKRSVPVGRFVEGLYATTLKAGELVTGVSFSVPAKGSGGAYCVFKRCAPAYPTSSVAVHLTLDGPTCRDARIALGASGLTTIHAVAAEAELRGKTLDEKSVRRAAEAAAAAADPVEDQRGSPEFKRFLLNSLVRRGLDIARRRCVGEQIEVNHEYY